VEEKIQKLNEVLRAPLTVRSRVFVLIAVVFLVPTFFLPLWHMSFLSQQYPEGLDLYIYTHDLVGGDGGNDLTEINVLNHYIGMAELRVEDFSELKWIPMVIGFIGILGLRTVVIGTLKSLIDIIVVSGYFGLFSLWSFWYKLYKYGHNLDPRAAVHVDPFTPPVFGYKMVGQFEVWSYPSLGTYMFLICGVLLLLAVYYSLPHKQKIKTVR
jgi:hypothetical protein